MRVGRTLTYFSGAAFLGATPEARAVFPRLEYRHQQCRSSMRSRVSGRGYRYMPIDLIYRQRGCATGAAVHSPCERTCSSGRPRWKMSVVSDTRGDIRDSIPNARYRAAQLFIQAYSHRGTLILLLMQRGFCPDSAKQYLLRELPR